MNRLFRRRDERGMALVTVIMLSMITVMSAMPRSSRRRKSRFMMSFL